MAQVRLNNARLLIYSHDTYGLGHLRRCRTIAHALVKRFKGLSVLIVSGSPIIGRFEFRARVDYVRIPGVIKLYNGEYTSLGLHIDIQQTLDIRKAIIQHTALSFQPDVFLVDKEPLGLKGEVEPTLRVLRETGVKTVLGLRDVMDDPQWLADEWQQKGIPPKLLDLYDDIWVYGPASMGSPLTGIEFPEPVDPRLYFTGYLARHVPKTAELDLSALPDRYLLVTPGGGGDGVEMVDWVLRAYESSSKLPAAAVIILGPFMGAAEREQFERRVVSLPQVIIHTFDRHIEALMANASAVVAMGGYNTFCEILSLRKPALLVPRKKPRLEQFIRATQAEALGLVKVLDLEEDDSTECMVQALQQLSCQPPLKENQVNGLLTGQERIAKRFLTLLGQHQVEQLNKVEG
ncbi:glycosyltransferase family protein [Zooshikella ganghwensis]|uniref:glycosyltransferase family protein n=1 Tax=Zooshikella ganghwensis TaxID=202772 RepID=UPI0004097A76|nr:glycosyltransferase [Zooshikella ganghwensis]